MIVKRVVKFNIKKNHVDYNYIKQQSIESKEIYNYANYIVRQIFFKKSKKHKFSLDFVDEYPELKDLFAKYIEEDKQFTSLLYNIICKFARLKEFSINTKIVQNIVDKLKSDWNSYWALFNLMKNKQYEKQVNIPKYKKQYNLVEYNSFLDNDNIPTFNEDNNQKHTFSGKRITRNLYKTKNNQIIDADLNGALNIMKKANIKMLTSLDYLKFNNIFTSTLV
jgi:putative transposase